MKTLRLSGIFMIVAFVSSVAVRAAATRPFDNALCEGELQDCGKALAEAKVKIAALQAQLDEATKALAECKAGNALKKAPRD